MVNAKFKVGDYITPEHRSPKVTIGIVRGIIPREDVNPTFNVSFEHEEFYYQIELLLDVEKEEQAEIGEVFEVGVNDCESACRVLSTEELVLYLPR